MTGQKPFVKDLSEGGSRRCALRGRAECKRHPCVCTGLGMGLGGGRAFELFFLLFGSEADHTAYYTYDAAASVPGPSAASAAQHLKTFVDGLTERYFKAYLGFVTVCGKAISQKRNAGLVIVTQIAQKCGLSNNGVEMLSHLGILTPLTTSKRKDTVLLKDYGEHLDQTLAWTVSSVWVDNFSRFYFTSVVRADRDIARTTGNVSAMAVILGRAPVHLTSFKFVRINTGATVLLPALDANTMFTDVILRAAAADLTKRAGALFKPDHYDTYYRRSFCHRLQLYNNPLKPPLPAGAEERAGFYPYSMLATGTSSTIEVTKTFEWLQDWNRKVYWQHGRYSFMTVDVAIYLAYMRQVLGTERDGTLKEMRLHNLPINGFWHVSKTLLLKLYDYCFLWLIVPFRRRVNPGQTVYMVNLRVGTVVRTFNMLAAAYERDRDSWTRYYDGATNSQPRHALRQFFEFLLPFVRTQAFHALLLPTREGGKTGKEERRDGKTNRG